MLDAWATPNANHHEMLAMPLLDAHPAWCVRNAPYELDKNIAAFDLCQKAKTGKAYSAIER
jgi:hypothetical protein